MRGRKFDGCREEKANGTSLRGSRYVVEQAAFSYCYERATYFLRVLRVCRYLYHTRELYGGTALIVFLVPKLLLVVCTRRLPTVDSDVDVLGKKRVEGVVKCLLVGSLVDGFQIVFGEGAESGERDFQVCRHNFL